MMHSTAIRQQGAARADNRPSIAVMPFTLTDDSGDRYLSDGITEDIITELSRFREVMVTGRGSSFRCGSFATDIRRVSDELGVRYVLEGSVRRAGQRLRITCELIDSETDGQVWSDRLDETMDDILAMQAEIAARVVGSVVPELLQAEQQRAARFAVGNVPAYEMALRAGNLISRGIAKHELALLSQGIEIAREAVEMDPLCMRAHYAMAWGYCRRGTMGYIGADSMGDLERAMAAALRLREVEPRNHAAYAVMGHIDMRLLRHEDSLTNLAQANHLNPNDVTTLRWLAWEKANHGLASEAHAHAELSLKLSPRDRFLDQGYWTLALSAYVAGDLEECITYGRRALALNRGYGGHYVLLAAALAETGAVAEAETLCQHLLRTYPGLLESRLAGRTYFVSTELTARYRHALHRAAGRLAGTPAAPSTPSVLSSREQQVLRLVARGLSNGAVAEALQLSEHTVKRHVANILMKLDLPTRAAAVAEGVRLGWL